MNVYRGAQVSRTPSNGLPGLQIWRMQSKRISQRMWCGVRGCRCRSAHWLPSPRTIWPFPASCGRWRRWRGRRRQGRGVGQHRVPQPRPGRSASRSRCPVAQLRCNGLERRTRPRWRCIFRRKCRRRRIQRARLLRNLRFRRWHRSLGSGMRGCGGVVSGVGWTLRRWRRLRG